VSKAARLSVIGPGMWLLVGRAGGAAFAAAFLVVAARALEPATFGKLAVLLGIATFVGVVAEAGLPLLVVEMVAADPPRGRAVMTAALRLRVAATAVGVVAVAMASAALGLGLAPGVLYGVAMLASALQTTAGAALRAVGRVAPEGLAELTVRAATLAVGLLLVSAWPTPASVTAAYAVAGTATAAWLLVFANRALPALDGSAPVAIPLRRAAGLGANAVLVTLYNRIDLWLLAALASSTAAGLYAAVYRLYEGLVLPGTAFGLLLAAAGTRAAGSADDERRAYRHHVATAVGLTAIGAAAIVLFAHPLVDVLFGSEFADAVPALRLLAVAAVPAVALSTLSPITSLRDRRATLDVVAAAIVVAVGLNVVLIPRLEQTGAAAAMVVSQSVVAALIARRALAQLRRPARATS
jgi:O-antigen/teichoic acid export membrane protein